MSRVSTFVCQIGQQFGRWTIVSGPHQHPKWPANRHPVWLCRCSCGEQGTIVQGDLRSWKSLSCGCIRNEMTTARNRTHGQAGTVAHKRWKGMLNRCRNPHDKNYRHYGGRGIKVCDRWQGEDGFANFLTDMGQPPTSKHDLDRFPDNDGPYSPTNCRWATHKANTRNTRKNRLIEHGGVCLTLSEWSERTGLNVSTIHSRLGRLGWSVHRALTEPRQ